MPKLLTATAVGARALTDAARVVHDGTFPGLTTYPGSGGGGVYPGPTTYPPTAPGAGDFLYPGRGDTLFVDAATNRSLNATAVS